MLTSTTSQRIEISTGPPNYIRPAFPEHHATSPILLRELLPDDLKSFFSETEPERDEVEVVDIPPAHRPTTAQPQYSCFLPRLRPSDPVSTTLPFWSSPRCHQHESYYHCHLLRPPLRHPIATAVSARRSPGR